MYRTVNDQVETFSNELKELKYVLSFVDTGDL